MKHGKRPTRNQKKMLSELGLNPDNWLIVKDNANELVIVHRVSEQVRTLKRKWNREE